MLPYLLSAILGKMLGETPKLSRLNLDDKLSDIREELRKIIDETSSFSKNISKNEFAEIGLVDEDKFLFKTIVENISNISPEKIQIRSWMYLKMLMKEHLWLDLNQKKIG